MLLKNKKFFGSQKAVLWVLGIRKLMINMDMLPGIGRPKKILQNKSK